MHSIHLQTRENMKEEQDGRDPINTPMLNNNNNNDDDEHSCSSTSTDDSDLAFAKMDFDGVDFGMDTDEEKDVEVSAGDGNDKQGQYTRTTTTSSSSSKDMEKESLNDNNPQSRPTHHHTENTTSYTSTIINTNTTCTHEKKAAYQELIQPPTPTANNTTINTATTATTTTTTTTTKAITTTTTTNGTIRKSQPSTTMSFDKILSNQSVIKENTLLPNDKVALEYEQMLLHHECCLKDDDDSVTNNTSTHQSEKNEMEHDDSNDNNENVVLTQIRTLSQQLSKGEYLEILNGPTASTLFPTSLQDLDIPSTRSSTTPSTSTSTGTGTGTTRTTSSSTSKTLISQIIRTLVIDYCTTPTKCVQVELFAVAALNVFLQINYTGPLIPGVDDHVYSTFSTTTIADDDDDDDDANGGEESKDDSRIGNKEGIERPDDVEGKAKRLEMRKLLHLTNPHLVFANYWKEQHNNSKDESQSPSSSSSCDKNEDTTDENKIHSTTKETTTIKEKASLHNAILSELSVEGEWPYQVVHGPYYLLLARCILSTLSDPNRPNWTNSIVTMGNATSDSKIVIRNHSQSFTSHNGHDSDEGGINDTITHHTQPSIDVVTASTHLKCVHLWNARAIVAHARLLQGDEPSYTLWSEVDAAFQQCVLLYCNSSDSNNSMSKEEKLKASKTMLEYGLAEHHFDQNKRGKVKFQRALEYCGLNVQVTGAEGKRTKYQTKATAQMLVKAKPGGVDERVVTSHDVRKDVTCTEATTTKEPVSSSSTSEHEKPTNDDTSDTIHKQMIQHNEDTILFDKVKFEDDQDNAHYQLTILEQTILLALCLDVKNDNPMDGLTAEEMGAFLERVLQQHDDWMVYATGLLERAWLESERNHTRERAILQIQALADQHTNRLTLTQSTHQAAVEDSAPPQERLQNLHFIVYPPRWAVLRDLAERYAKIGIVTSAAEIFEEIELWDEVVICYRRGGKENKAEQVVRKRLEEVETPRMWSALGDITKDVAHYHRALRVSNGKFWNAYVALGQHYFDEGDIEKSANYFKEAVSLKPLSPHVWFKLGAISMRLKDWDTALHAFTEVVQQEPEEGDAWANVAAVHMHNNNPDEAYPALVESLKLNRNNWRVWESKLFVCLDLRKYDEAVQACLFLMDYRFKKNATENIPQVGEKVVRAIIGGSISQHEAAIKTNDSAMIDSSQRTLSRVRELLTKVTASLKSEPWIHESCAYFNARVGRSDLVLENLMKEYRSLQSIRGWETDNKALPRTALVVSYIAEIHLAQENADCLRKFKFLLNGVIRKIKAAYFIGKELPKEVDELEKLLQTVQSKISVL